MPQNESVRKRRGLKEYSYSQTGGPGLCRRAPGGPLTESEREEGPISWHYTGGAKSSRLSAPEIFRFFQRRRFDLAAIDRRGGGGREHGGRRQQKQEEEQHT